MSVDLTIIPTQHRLFTWGQLREHWFSLLDAPYTEIAASRPLLISVSPGKQVPVLLTDTIEVGRLYHLAETRLGFGTHFNAKIGLENIERDYIDEFDDLDEQTKDEVAARWHDIGYTYDLTSSAGRIKYEIMLMIRLAAALAVLSDGYVYADEPDVFGVPLGFYTVEQFRGAIPRVV